MIHLKKINKMFLVELVHFFWIISFFWVSQQNLPVWFHYFPLHFSDLNYVEEIKGYTVSNHGRAQLVDQRNYTYNVHGKKANRIFWRCSKKHKKCKGRASTFENYIMKLSGIHNHEPNPNVVNKMLNSNVDPLKKDE